MCYASDPLLNCATMVTPGNWFNSANWLRNCAIAHLPVKLCLVLARVARSSYPVPVGSHYNCYVSYSRHGTEETPIKCNPEYEGLDF